MISPDENGDLKAAAEEEKRYCQSELEKLNERRRQVLVDLGAAVAEHEKDNPAFWADYPAEDSALSNIEEQIEMLEMCIADAEKAIEQENNRKESNQIKNSPWTKICSCGAVCPALAKFCPSCGTKINADGDADSDSTPAPQPEKAMRRCPLCGKEYSAEFVFCELCGVSLEEIPAEEPNTDQTAPIPVDGLARQNSQQKPVTDGYAVCPICGLANKSRAKFCGNCGTQLH